MTKLHKLILPALLLTVTTAHSEEIKLRNNGDACTSSNEGAIYYDDGDDTFYFCRNASTGWEAFEDLAPASSGGGAPTYAGITTATTDGTPPTFTGLKGMDAMCAAEYAGGRMMRSSDMKFIYADITGSTEAWVMCDTIINTGQSNEAYCIESPNDLLGTDAKYINCRTFQYTGTSTNLKGLTYTGSSGSFSSAGCDSVESVHCVTD